MQVYAAVNATGLLYTSISYGFSQRFKYFLHKYIFYVFFAILVLFMASTKIFEITPI